MLFFSIAKCFKKNSQLFFARYGRHILLELLETPVMRSTIRKNQNPTSSIFDLKVEDEPSEDFYDDIDLDLLIDAVRKLDDKLKSVIAYKVYYDLTADEIAQIMGISKRTVFNYLNKAKRQILDLIGGDRFE